MKTEIVIQLHQSFEESAQKEESTGVEFWFARDLQRLLGYSQWRNFEPIIKKGITACKNSKQNSEDHFARARKMVPIGSGAEKEIDDYALTRYACYLIAQNGDPRKEEIAFAQSYFAFQTRKMEVVEKRIREIERLDARKKLTESEKQLSGIIFERLKSNESFAKIRSQGDAALFGGLSTQQMKKRLGVPQSRALADFLPTISIKAKDFANEITAFKIQSGNLRTEGKISQEHITSNRRVRKTLTDSGIVPESLPPEEDVKKLERRLGSEKKKLESND